MSFQQVTIMGNLGDAPEVRYTQSGKAVCNFSVAVNEGTREKPNTTWFRVVAWEKTAELCGEYLNKGSQCLVNGRMQVRKYEDKEGVERQAWELVANTVRFVGSKRESDDEPRRDRQERRTRKPDIPFGDDDIPF